MAIAAKKPNLLPLANYLSVGTAVVITPDPSPKDAPRVRSALRGWHSPNYLMLEAPNEEPFRNELWADMPCIVRFFSAGQAGGFRSSITTWRTDAAPELLFVRWPDEYEVLAVRKNERVDLTTDGEAWREDEQKAIPCSITDISESGCGVKMNASWDCGALINVRFTIPTSGVSEAVLCRVQNVRTLGDEYHLGCQFVNPLPAYRDAVRYYVSSILDRSRMPPHNRVVIIDDRQEDIAPLVTALESKSYDVVVAPSTIDGAFRVRLAETQAVLVSEEIPDIRGIDFARMLIRTPGLENVAIYLYGGTDSDLPALAKEAQLSGYFKAGTRPEQIIRDLDRALNA